MEMNIAEIRDNLAEALNRVAYGGERVVLKRRNRKVAVLVSIEDWELLEELENEADIRAARQARKEKGRVSLDSVKKRLGMR